MEFCTDVMSIAVLLYAVNLTHFISLYVLFDISQHTHYWLLYFAYHNTFTLPSLLSLALLAGHFFNSTSTTSTLLSLHDHRDY